MTQKQFNRRRKLWDMHESGLSNSEIARIEGVSRQRISQLIIEYKQILGEDYAITTRRTEA